MINHTITESSQLIKKRTGMMRVDKVIHWESCKKLKFQHSDKWYIHKSESVLENETSNIL